MPATRPTTVETAMASRTAHSRTGAVKLVDATAINTFAQPLTVKFNYASLRSALKGTGPLAIFTLNDSTGRWESVPFTHDRTNTTLSADITHFSSWAIGEFSGLNQLPSTGNFAEDLFTGAATVQYPLAMAAMPAWKAACAAIT